MEVNVQSLQCQSRRHLFHVCRQLWKAGAVDVIEPTTDEFDGGLHIGHLRLQGGHHLDLMLNVVQTFNKGLNLSPDCHFDFTKEFLLEGRAGDADGLLGDVTLTPAASQGSIEIGHGGNARYGRGALVRGVTAHIRRLHQIPLRGLGHDYHKGVHD